MLAKLLNILLLSTLSISCAVAEDTPIAQLKAFLHSSAALSADFRQVSLDKNGDPKQSSYGKFYLSRPGKFRWNYQKPFVQEIVSNGGKVWFYDADLEQNDKTGRTCDHARIAVQDRDDDRHIRTADGNDHENAKDA